MTLLYHHLYQWFHDPTENHWHQTNKPEERRLGTKLPTSTPIRSYLHSAHLQVERVLSAAPSAPPRVAAPLVYTTGDEIVVIANLQKNNSLYAEGFCSSSQFKKSMKNPDHLRVSPPLRQFKFVQVTLHRVHQITSGSHNVH